MKKLILIIVLAGLILLTGCSLSEEEIFSRVIESNSGLESYSFDMTMNMETKTEINDQPVSIKSEIDSKGKVDNINKIMSIIGTMKMDVGRVKQETDMSIYLTDNFMYTKAGDLWMKTGINEEIWNEQDQIQNTIELVRSGTTELLEDETIEGEEHYVLKINPDLRKVIEQVLKSQEKADLFNMNMDFEDIIKSYSLTVWVNKETFFMKKMRTNMDMVMTRDNTGMIDSKEDFNDFEIKSTSDIIITDVDEKFVITLPKEAENAVSMAELMES